jgi:hypothetical protein
MMETNEFGVSKTRQILAEVVMIAGMSVASVLMVPGLTVFWVTTQISGLIEEDSSWWLV